MKFLSNNTWIIEELLSNLKDEQMFEAVEQIGYEM